MIPPNPAHPNVREDQERVSDALVAAVKNAGVEYAVVLSSIGADKPVKTGPVVGLHNLEQKLNGVAALKAVYLRAGYFMENLLPQVGIIQKFGMTGGPLRGDLKVAMIATRDIGAAAAESLAETRFHRQTGARASGAARLDLPGSGGCHRQGNRQTQPRLYAVSARTTQTRFDANGHVFQYG